MSPSLPYRQQELQRENKVRCTSFKNKYANGQEKTSVISTNNNNNGNIFSNLMSCLCKNKRKKSGHSTVDRTSIFVQSPPIQISPLTTPTMLSTNSLTEASASLLPREMHRHVLLAHQFPPLYLFTILTNSRYLVPRSLNRYSDLKRGRFVCWKRRKDSTSVAGIS